jgi:proteasome accessory factor A
MEGKATMAVPKVLGTEIEYGVIVFCGAGKVGAENGTDPCTYQISQRADFFETEVGLDTMVKRPLINTRDEPHANRDRYRRLHVILGDSNMSEYSIYVRVGITALVLQMIEDGFINKDLSLQNPVKAVKDVSRDLSCKQPIELASGQKLSAVDVQREYLETISITDEACPASHPQQGTGQLQQA